MAESTVRPGLVVALDVNGTIVDGDSLNAEKSVSEASVSLSLTEPARKLIQEITTRISIGKQSIRVVVYTFGVDWPVWPGVLAENPEIEALSNNVITFDHQAGALYVGRAADADPPAVFVRELTEDTKDQVEHPFEHDGVLYNGSNPVWQQPGPKLSYDEFRERTTGQHLVMRAVCTSGNPTVLGRQDNVVQARWKSDCERAPGARV